MVNTTHAKRGRKPKPYVCPWNNETIDGLRQRPSDGRWESSDGSTFTESDPRLAVARYLSNRSGPKSAIILPLHDEERPELSNHQPANAAHVVFNDEADGYTEIGVPLRVLCGWFREQIIARPQWLSQHVGIEQLGWLTDLRKPEPLPSLALLEQTWSDYMTAGAEQRRKVLHAWQDFKTTANVKSIADITPQLVIAYRDTVHSRNLSGKSQSNLFTRIRRLVSFAKSRAIAVDAMSKALDSLSLPTPDETTVGHDPKPIEPEDYRTLLEAATGDDRAMILLMLNAAMYLQEVVSLRWSDIKNGCIVTHRKKTGRCVRIAVLWPETIEALANVKRRGDHVFISYTGAQLGIKGAEKRFRDLRDGAKLPHVTSSMMRDGAYTAAVEHNVTENLCKLLVGHATGIADHYVKRKPSMVAPACEAIHRHYLG